MNNSRKSSFKHRVLTTARKIADSGLTVGTWGNVSIKCSSSQSVYITPSGIPFTDLEEDDIVCIEADGKVHGKRKPSIELPSHRAVYGKRPDVFCVVHTHSLYSTALGVSGLELPGICEDFVQVAGSHAALAEYALPGSPELAENVAEALGDRFSVLMPNHGAICCGKDENTALTICALLEKSAQVFIMSHSLGNVNVIPPKDILTMQNFMKNSYGQ